MFETLQEIKDKCKIDFDAKKYDGYTDFILNVFNNGTNDEPLDSISHDVTKLNICGLYHHDVTKNYVEMEKYYLMAIELGNVITMYNLGLYHRQVTKNYVEMEKYYLMAIELGDADAMNNLGVYHYIVTKNYVEMEKYYLMAIELGNADAMSNLGVYHCHVTKNDAEMEKYYLMAIELGDAAAAMNHLVQYHRNNVVDVFECLDRHFDSKSDHTDAFLAEYCKLLKEDAVQSHIQNKIKCELRSSANNSLINTHLYKKYIQTGEEAVGAYASDFTIIVNCAVTLDSESDVKEGDSKETTKIYPIHSHVLNSEYFLNLIDSGFMQTTEVAMQVSDFSVMDILLNYLYTNAWITDANITKKYLESIRQLADEFAFDSLVNLCKWTAKLNGLCMYVK